MDKITISREDFIQFMLLHESPYLKDPTDRELWELHWNVKFDLLEISLQNKYHSISKRIKDFAAKFIFLFTSNK